MWRSKVNFRCHSSRAIYIVFEVRFSARITNTPGLPTSPWFLGNQTNVLVLERQELDRLSHLLRHPFCSPLSLRSVQTGVFDPACVAYPSRICQELAGTLCLLASVEVDGMLLCT